MRRRLRTCRKLLMSCALGINLNWVVVMGRGEVVMVVKAVGVIQGRLAMLEDKGLGGKGGRCPGPEVNKMRAIFSLAELVQPIFPLFLRINYCSEHRLGTKVVLGGWGLGTKELGNKNKVDI